MLIRIIVTQTIVLSLLLFTGHGIAGADYPKTKEEIIRQCVQVLQAHPKDAATRSTLRRVFTDEYPLQLTANVLSYLPIPHEQCKDQVADSTPGQEAFYTTGLAFPDASHRRDPVANQTFNRVLYGYVKGDSGDWIQAFKVLYNSSQPGAEELAPRVMRTLLRVRAAHLALFGDARKVFSHPIDVWIRGEGDGGAEQSGPNLFLLGGLKDRQPLELLRQVAHEMGHLALPPLGPLQDPERWGSGFIGEMLVLRRLSLALDEDKNEASRDELASYVRQQFEPLARAFNAAGWKALERNGASSGDLRLLLGMILDLEDTQGPVAVAQLMRSVRGSSVADWVSAARPLMQKISGNVPEQPLLQAPAGSGEK